MKKHLSLLATMTVVLISNFSFAHTTTKAVESGTITFIGAIVEPQCEINVANRQQINIDCYRNGKNIIKTSSVTDAKKLSCDHVKVEYVLFNKKPMLNIIYL
ncbi:hypothetical protein [Providencia burhodogranariea]|uniref:Fimbrial protein n=1 Tax=Providencia burhodogranariea DSM 19968 TaxID=1141662 RepID=K8WDD3_9GAMM|nr:hypothetical protein [Providencia burhodogranariea]EKT55452.1 hypothetical protein OOA_16714 [Providencia burhodogranariea DSM 19968]